MNEIPSQTDAILSTLSPAMRRALLSAKPLREEPEWDTLADYCPGHEPEPGRDHVMGETVYCEGNNVCHQARVAYDRDRDPDPDRKVITISPDVTIGTVVALIGRSLVEPAANTRTRDHELTDLGLCIRHVLVDLQERGQAGTERVNRKAVRLARTLADRATTHHVLPHAMSTVMLLLVREGAVKGTQAELFNDVMRELDAMAAQR